jgi:isopenicillin-N epimerase
MYNLKKLFLLDPTVTFLNHGSFGATPKPVFDVYQRWQLELERQPVEFLGRRFSALLAESRAALGEYLATHADNLVYTQNATIAINIVARSLALGAGDEVLTSDHEYGAIDRTWRFLAKERGFAYLRRSVSLASKAEFVASFWAGVTPRTRVILLSHITSPTALIFPVEEIIQRARAAGILTIIDGAHVPGQIPLALGALGADFYAGNLHKWLCAPKGAGFLYARPAVQHLLKPLVVSWGYEPETPGASTFVDHHEWWGTRDIAAFLTVPAAIQFQQKHHWHTVQAACHHLAAETQRQICALTGLPPLHSTAEDWFAQLTAAPLPVETDLVALKARLYEDYRIEAPMIDWLSASGSRVKLIRVSLQGYNSKRDVTYLLAALKALLPKK